MRISRDWGRDNAALEVIRAKAGGRLPPLKTHEECAEMLGLQTTHKLNALRRKHPQHPFPEARLKRTNSKTKDWFDPAQVRAWFKSLPQPAAQPSSTENPNG